MKSAKILNGEIKLIQREKPSLKDLGAIIKVEGCGLCGSDIVKIKAGDKNAVLGHEITGEIVEINSNTAFCKGDKVVMGHHYPCMECDFCKNESFSMCETFKSTNIYPCGFSEYIFASEGHLKNTVFKVPEDMDSESASFLEPLACCVRAVRRANLKGHQKALVMGLGSIGLLMAQAIREFGNQVKGVDVKKERQDFAENFNILMDKNINYDAVFLTSGSSYALPDALKYVKNGGKIIVFSSVEQVNKEAGYTNNEIYYRELSVLGSYSPSIEDLHTAFNLLKNKAVNTENISTIYPLDNLAQAVDDTITNKVFKAYIKIL